MYSIKVSNEILDFNQFENFDLIDQLLHSFDGLNQHNKNLSYEYFFDLACIKEQSYVAQYIFEKSLTKNVTWNFFYRVKICIKYFNAQLLEFLLNQSYDLSDHKIELLNEAIYNQNSFAIKKLFPLFNYSTNDLKELFHFAFDNYSYSAIEQILSLDKSLITLNEETITTTLFELYSLVEYSSEEIDFICYLVDLGGNVDLFNNSPAILYMVLDNEFEKVVKLLLKGMKIEPDVNTVDYALSEYNSLLEDATEQLEDFKKYLSYHYPQHNFYITNLSLDNNGTK